MRIFTLIIVVLSLLAILEFTSVIPSTSFSILNSFSQIAAFIKSLNIESYYIIVPNISITLPGIITTLIILFVVGYISERFKNLEKENKILSKELSKLENHVSTIKRSDDVDNDASGKQSDFKEIATEIRNFLSKLAESVNANSPVPIRSKKIRRTLTPSSSSDSAIATDEPSVTQKEEILDLDGGVLDSGTTRDDKYVTENVEEFDDASLQDEVSSIDLARALIESGEKDKAKEILITIIKTGSPDDAHEARILNLQIS